MHRYFIRSNKLKVADRLGVIGEIRGHITKNQLEEQAKIDEFMYTKIKHNVGNKAIMKEQRTKN